MPLPPATEMTVINRCFLYLNMLRKLALYLNDSLFHIKPALSRKTRLPGFGALCTSRAAGFSRRRLQHTAAVTASTATDVAIKDMTPVNG